VKTAIQLYTLRNRLSEGVEKVLKEIREMGYEGVEWYYLPDNSPEKAAELSKAAGLEIFSAHIDINIVLASDRELLKRLAKAGFKYLPIGWLPQERLAGGPLFAETCDAIRTYAEMAKEEGLYVMYHNHDFDLAEVPGDDRRALDILFDTLPAEIFGAEPDTCWLYSGGVDPVAYLKKYAHRSPVIHLKDCVKEGGRSGYKPVGDGVLDFEAILPHCGQAEWVCVEQDEPNDGLTDFESAKRSADNLKKLLQK
jgi:sugar phosphate isomerase/epimerase